jgi:hypothetical protein
LKTKILKKLNDNILVLKRIIAMQNLIIKQLRAKIKKMKLLSPKVIAKKVKKYLGIDLENLY